MTVAVVCVQPVTPASPMMSQRAGSLKTERDDLPHADEPIMTELEQKLQQQATIKSV